MARLFNGTSDWIDLGNDTQIDPARTMTVLAQIRPTSVSVDQTFLCRGISGATGYNAGVNAAGNLRFSKNSTVDIASSVAGCKPVLSVWQLIAFVLTPTNVRFIRVTAAGVLTGENVADSNGYVAGSTLTQLGANFEAGVQVEYTPGALADISVVIGAALSDVSVTRYATNGPDSLGPIYRGQWLLRGSDPEPDTSIYGFSGTLNGTTVVEGPVYTGDPTIPFPPHIGGKGSC